MARQEINLGTPPTGVGGDTTRTTGTKINAMMTELYLRNSQLGTASNTNTGTAPGNVMLVGAFGLGSASAPISASPSVVGFSVTSGAGADQTPSTGSGGSRITMNTGGLLFNELVIAANSATSPTLGYRQFNSNGVPGPWNIVYTNQNTTRAQDGTLKAI